MANRIVAEGALPAAISVVPALSQAPVVPVLAVVPAPSAPLAPAPSAPSAPAPSAPSAPVSEVPAPPAPVSEAPVSPAPGSEAPPGFKPVKSVLAAMDVLECFVDCEELGVTQIAQRLGAAKSTAHRLLAALCARGVIRRIPATGRYRLGLHLFELGQLAQSREPMRQAALPLLDDLRMATGQTAQLSVADGPDVVFLERLPTMQGIPLLGDRTRRMPAHTTSAGKVIAAFDSDIEQACLAAGLSAYTAETITDPGQWRDLLVQVRRRGYAYSTGENLTGLASVAAPVRDAVGHARAAVSVAGPAGAFDGQVARCSRAVMVTADKLAHRLGW